MHNLKRYIFVLFFFGVLFGVSWWGFDSNPPTPENIAISEIHPAQSKQPRVVKDMRNHSIAPVTTVKARVAFEQVDPWRVGTEYSYQMMLANKMTIEGQSATEQNTIGVFLDGNLALAVIEDNAETVVLRAKIEDLRLQIDNNRVNESASVAQVKEKLQSNLTTPFYLVMERNGRIQSIRMPSELTTTSATLLRSITANLQFVHPKLLKQSWQFTEQDHVGEYQAQYQRIDKGIYEKRKLTYQKIATPEGLTATNNIGTYQVDFQSTFKFNDNAGLKSISATETVYAAVMGGFQFETQQDMELTLVNTNEVYDLIPEWLSEMNQIAASQLASITPGEDPHRKSQEKLLNNADIKTLIGELRSLDFSDVSSEVTDEKIMSVRRRLTALFALQPDMAKQVLGEFDAESGLGVEQMSILAGALASTETPQAQAVLGDVALKQDLSTDFRNTAVALLGMSTEPTENTVDTLFMLQRSDEESVSTTANLALGSIAETITKKNPETAEQIVTSLLQAFEKSDTDDTKLFSLEALANTGDERIIPGVASILDEGSEALRTSGVEALRFVKNPKAIELIAKTLDHDAQSSVRQAAIRAMDYHPIEEFLPNLNAVARNDEDSSVRLQIVDRTGDRLSELSEGRELLAWIADNDPDPTIREHAVDYVCNFNPDACVD